MRTASRAQSLTLPIRIAVYQGIQVSTLDGGRACFLELVGTAGTSRADPNRSVAYASYDVASRTIHTGLIVDHRAVDGCSMSIPVPRP